MVKLTEHLVLARARATDLENVRKLNCWGSDLSDIRVVRKLLNVQVISLSVNKISTLEDLSYCDNLEELYIRKNKISNLAEVCHLRRLPKLRVLWLSDNPCAVGDNYRMTVLKALPNLQKLDNIAVTEEEANAAIEQGIDISLMTRGKSPPKREESEGVESIENLATLTLCETNKIREQLGMKALPMEKAQVAPSSVTVSSKKAKERNSHILQAVMCLIKELDADSLVMVGNAVKTRLDSM